MNDKAPVDSDRIAALLAADLTSATGIEFAPGDLLRRHDGAPPAIIGALIVATPDQRDVIEELVRVWLAEGLLSELSTPESKAPVTVDLPGLAAGDVRVLDGIRLATDPDRDLAEELWQLARVTVDLIGSARHALDLAAGSAPDPVAGWIARLRTRAAFRRLESTIGEGAELSASDIAELHGIIGRLYLDAAPRSIWSELQRRARTLAVDLLDRLGNRPTVDLDRAEGRFWEVFDNSACVSVDGTGHPKDTLVQIVRLPTPSEFGVAALASGDTR